MQATDPTPSEPTPTPAPVIGADDRTTEHHTAPTPAEHVKAFTAARPGDCISDH